MFIKVKATANARKELFEKITDDTFKISVKQRAERNMANDRIKEILSLEMKIPINKFRLISGHTSPSKIFSIND